MKKKILVLSDHALSTSGVGTQTRHLIEGLLKKNKYTFRQFGAALKHNDYRTVVVNEDFIIKPIDGFGSIDLLRVTLATEKPDALLIFTDPRFFIWLFEMEDEIHQVCPIAWWHVWDNKPYPKFNDSLYKATDLINCHSHHTYTQLVSHFPDKTNFVPHTVPPDIFNRLPKNLIKQHKREILGNENEDAFVGIWINRNAKRKRPADVLESWKIFIDDLDKKHNHKNAILIMHCDPMDQEGPNLIAVSEMLGIQDRVLFSTDRIDFSQMNVLYNISDFCLNISFAEGFGLSTLESMQTGTPIIAQKTGGLTRQVVDHRDGSENGFALDVEMQTLVGSQGVPYIYEDYVSSQTVAKAIMKMYELDENQKEKLSEKVLSYVNEEFSHQKTIDLWDESLSGLIENWKKNYKRYSISSL
jgi:glycosyltransferase involved in cell wall biosynthesis